MSDTQNALDDARAEIANLSILYEHAKAERDRLRRVVETVIYELEEEAKCRDNPMRVRITRIMAGWTLADVLRAALRGSEQGVDSELFKLRPVVEAARAERARFARIEPIWAEWEDPNGMQDGYWSCRVCDGVERDGASTGINDVAHDPNCPAIALEQALAALDAGEDES